MKKLIYTLVILAFASLANAQWTQLNSGTTVRLESMAVTDANTVYIVGGNPPSSFVNLKTTNGGLNWFSFAGSSSGGASVYFINANTGFLSGFNLSITTNAGNSWTTVYTPTDTAVVLEFHFPTPTIGYGVGMKVQLTPMQILGTYLVKTTNGGFNWTRLAPPISGIDKELKDIFFTDANTGYTVGWSDNPSASILLKTTNGGNNWSSLTAGTGDEIYGVQFTDANTGYVCGSFPTAIQKTTNAGASWFVTNQDQASDIYFINANTGFALCWNGIVRTNNAGANWTYQNTAFTDLLKIMFYGNYVGYAVGKDGLVVKTTNGGSVFISQINSNVPEKYSLSQNYPNPFNPTTNIRFDLPKSGSVKLVVFDALGREVATLVNEKLAPGTYEVDWNGSSYTSGVYFYKLMTGDFVETKKMLLVK